LGQDFESRLNVQARDGNLTTITGRMNCALSLAGHKIN